MLFYHHQLRPTCSTAIDSEFDIYRAALNQSVKAMSTLLERLRAPKLVVSVQEFFGIKYLKLDDNDDLLVSTENHEPDSRGTLHKRNISSGSSETDEGFNEPSGSSSSGGVSSVERAKCEADTEGRTVADRDAIKPFAVTNRFWYYLFVLGTELGDEIFYASMIPFWFWNVDGAVGRRVVFVWSIVMYIGSCQ